MRKGKRSQMLLRMTGSEGTRADGGATITAGFAVIVGFDVFTVMLAE